MQKLPLVKLPIFVRSFIFMIQICTTNLRKVIHYSKSNKIQNIDIQDIQMEHYTFKLIKFIQFSDTFPVSELTENSTEFYRLFYRYLSDAEFSE